MDWARILAYVTGMVDQELLARNEYLVTENPLGRRAVCRDRNDAAVHRLAVANYTRKNRRSLR